MNSFEEQSNNWLENYQAQFDNETKKYQKYFDQNIGLLEKNLQDKSKKFLLENVEKLKNSIYESDKNASEVFNKSLEHAKITKSDFGREAYLKTAIKTYKNTLENNKIKLERLVRDFGNL